MGLYDKNRSGSLESKDEDALKYHIIQKYEKKSYYVDPNTIQQSLNSATTTNVDLSSSSSSTSVPTSGFIGTTLTQRTQNSSTAYGRPTVSAAAKKSNGGIPSIPSSLSGIVLPPPTVDPFSSNSNFPKDDFSKAFGSSSTAKDNQTVEYVEIQRAPVATTAQPSLFPSPGVVKTLPSSVSPIEYVEIEAAPVASSSNAQESFANFDAAQFDTIAGKTYEKLSHFRERR